jgi:DME family drug/metabolite transporter
MFELFLAGILFGGITTGARFLASLQLSLYEISFFTLGLATLMLSPFALGQRISPKKLRFLALYGLGGALLQLAGFAGIILQVPVAIVSFFMYSQPIWTVVLSRLFLKEKIDHKRILAVFSALAGVALLANLTSAENYDTWGIVAPLIGGFLLAVWVVGGRKVAIEKEPASFVTLAYCSFTTLWLLLIYPLFKKVVPQPMFSGLSLSHSTITWVHLLWIVLISRVVSNWLFYKGMKKIEASRASIIVLIEPISVAIISAIAFSQPITRTLILGGSLILFANYLVVVSRKSLT